MFVCLFCFVWFLLLDKGKKFLLFSDCNKLIYGRVWTTNVVCGQHSLWILNINESHMILKWDIFVFELNINWNLMLAIQNLKWINKRITKYLKNTDCESIISRGQSIFLYCSPKWDISATHKLFSHYFWTLNKFINWLLYNAIKSPFFFLFFFWIIQKQHQSIKFVQFQYYNIG